MLGQGTMFPVDSTVVEDVCHSYHVMMAPGAGATLAQIWREGAQHARVSMEDDALPADHPRDLSPEGILPAGGRIRARISTLLQSNPSVWARVIASRRPVTWSLR